jgi:hypothetical protein
VICAFAAGWPYPFRVLLRSGRRVLVLTVVALAVVGVGGYSLYRHWFSAAPQTAGQAIEEASSAAAAMTSATATFTTQVNGLTAMFGTVRERVTPTSLATVRMTSIDGADRFAVTEVVTPSHIYVNMPSMTTNVGKPWLSVPVGDLGADAAMLPLYQTGALPTAAAALVSTANTVRKAGTSTVGGVKVTRYVGGINPATALAGLDTQLYQLLSPELTATKGTIGFTAWIDSHQDIRKVQTSASIGGQRTVTTIVITGVNLKVTITVPKTSQVAALSA